MKRIPTRWWLATLLGLGLGCTTGTTPTSSSSGGTGPDRPTGTTEFATRTGGNNSANSATGGGPSRGGEAGSPTADNGNMAGGGGSAPRAVEESDIYKVVGNHMFVMNRYRGLQILDISNLDAPVLIGRAPIYGWPRDMYVRDNKAYIIVSDYYSFWRDEAAVDSLVEPFYGSQLRIIDISNVNAPVVVGGINLAGDCHDSRIVGDVMYLVSTRYAWYSNYGSSDTEDKTTVVSINIADTSDIRVVDEEDFPRSGWEHHISVTPDTIYLASAGYGNWDDTTWQNRYFTDIRYIDISDPQGEIRVRGHYEIPGRVMDRWSMDEYQGTLRVASGASWGNGDVYLTSIDVANPDALNQVGQYTLQINESLTSARFDGPRGYLVTYRNIDPLFTFDLADPRAPRLLGELEMTGWLDFMLPMGDRVVALGHEDLTDAQGNRTISLAVSLIDVSTDQATLLDREVVGDGWGWVPSERDDFAKVFRVLPEQQLIVFPFHGWDWRTYRYNGGVQLLDVTRDTLTRRGLIENAGWVERGIPHGDNTVLTLSSEIFQVMDITNRDAPTVRGKLDLARNVMDFHVLNESQSVQLSGDWWRGDTSITVVPLTDPDAATPTSSLHVPAPYGRLFQNGSLTYVSSVQDTRDADGNVTGRTTHVDVIDLSNPAAPRVRGSVNLPTEIYASYGYWYWGYGDQVVQVNDTTLAFFHFAYNYWWGEGDSTAQGPVNALYLVDLSNPDAPTVASTQELADVQWAWGLQARGNTLYLSEYDSFQGDDGYWYSRYFLRRVDVSNPAQPRVLPRVNIPGMFIGAKEDDRTIYTVENWWDDSNANDTRYRTYLHALIVQDDLAYLQSSVELPGYVYNMEIEGNAAFTTSQQWGYRTVNGNQEWYNDSKLLAVDLSNTNALRVAGNADLPLDWGWLMAVEGGRAFVSSGPGIFSFQVNDINHPEFEQFFRTQGWSNSIVVDGERAYVPSGYYGVQVLQLAQNQ